jgi:hypothetical protein
LCDEIEEGWAYADLWLGVLMMLSGRKLRMQTAQTDRGRRRHLSPMPDHTTVRYIDILTFIVSRSSLTPPFRSHVVQQKTIHGAYSTNRILLLLCAVFNLSFGARERLVLGPEESNNHRKHLTCPFSHLHCNGISRCEYECLSIKTVEILRSKYHGSCLLCSSRSLARVRD